MNFGLKCTLSVFLLFVLTFPGAAGNDSVVIRKHLSDYFNTRVKDPRKAMTSLQEGLEIAQQSGDSSHTAVLFYHKGYLYRTLGIYDLAIQSYLKALHIYEQLGDRNLIAWLYVDIGNLYFLQKSKLLFALDHYRKAEYIFNQLKNTEGRIVASYNMGLTYRDKAAMDSALYYFSRAEKMSREMKDTINQALSISYQGQTYLTMERFGEAEKYFNRSLLLSRQKKDTNGIAYSYDNIASLNLARKEVAKASENHKISLSFYEKLKDKVNISVQLEKLGRIYAGQGDYPKAVEFSLLAYGIAESNSLLTQQQTALPLLAEYYSNLNRHPEAFFYLQKYNEIKESVINRNLQQYQTEYELEIKQRESAFFKKENELREKEIRRQEIIIYASIVSLILLSMLLWIIIFKSRQLKKSNAYLFRSSIELVKKEKELQDIKKETRYSGSALSREQHQELFTRLLELINMQKAYLDPGISIDELAKRLDTNRTYLSRIINEKLNTNFNSFINEYRVKEAQRILLEENEKFTIEGIARSVGFNSKSSFNTAFKKMTGLTPSEYINLKKEQSLT